MKKISKKTTGLLIAILLVIAVGALILFVLRPSIEVTCINGDDCRQMGAMGGVVLSFSRPVDADQFEALISVDGASEGSWVWLDSQNVRWMASEVLLPGETVTFSLLEGDLGLSGERLRRALTWEIEVRGPDIAVLGESEQGYEVYVLTEGEEPAPLTHTDGRVQSFEPSPDGEQLALVVENEQGGVDLWLVTRNGSDQRVVVDCGEERCHSPAWSRDGTSLLYVRSTNESPEAGGQVWRNNIYSGTDQEVSEVKADNATQPRWSPDGKWISYVVLDEIFLVEWEAGETIQLTSADGSAGCWLADGSSYLYTATLADEFAIRNVVLRWQVQDGSLSCLCSAVSIEGARNFDRPVCHPRENVVVIRLQPNLRISGYQLDLLDLTENSDRLIANDLTKVFSQMSWSPSGDSLLIQAFQPGSGQSEPEIWVWQSDSSELTQIASGFTSPRWLP